VFLLRIYEKFIIFYVGITGNEFLEVIILEMGNFTKQRKSDINLIFTRIYHFFVILFIDYFGL